MFEQRLHVHFASIEHRIDHVIVELTYDDGLLDALPALACEHLGTQEAKFKASRALTMSTMTTSTTTNSISARHTKERPIRRGRRIAASRIVDVVGFERAIVLDLHSNAQVHELEQHRAQVKIERSKRGQIETLVRVAFDAIPNRLVVHRVLGYELFAFVVQWHQVVVEVIVAAGECVAFAAIDL